MPSELAGAGASDSFVVALFAAIASVVAASAVAMLAVAVFAVAAFAVDRFAVVTFAVSAVAVVLSFVGRGREDKVGFLAKVFWDAAKGVAADTTISLTKRFS